MDIRAVLPVIDRAAGSALDPLWPGWVDIINAAVLLDDQGNAITDLPGGEAIEAST